MEKQNAPASNPPAQPLKEGQQRQATPHLPTGAANSPQRTEPWCERTRARRRPPRPLGSADPPQHQAPQPLQHYAFSFQFTHTRHQRMKLRHVAREPLHFFA